MLRRRSIVVAIVSAALAATAGCGGDDESDGGGGGGGGDAAPQQQQAASGQELFSNTCGGCHTLADAQTDGQVGPNLDELMPDRERVLTALRTGPGAMPENLLVGEEAETVATYVSSVAGN